jgi:hypothetical protein
MVYDTYTISKINSKQDCLTMMQRFQWLNNHKHLTQSNIIIRLKFPNEHENTCVEINATDISEKKKCTIGILTTYNRINFLIRLVSWMREIITDEISNNFEILLNISDIDITVGEKRNNILNSANSDYICFIDDDDMISSNYFNLLYKAFDNDPDAIGFMGKIYYLDEAGLNAKNIIPFIHCNSLVSKHISGEETGKMIKVPLVDKSLTFDENIFPSEIVHCSIYTHLCPIKLNIAKQFKFEHKSFNEDLPWAKKIFDSGLIKRENFIKKNLYQYLYRHNKIGE